MMANRPSFIARLLGRTDEGWEQSVKKPSGLTKGGWGDPLARQVYTRGRIIGVDEARRLYEGNWLAGNIVDTLAEDLTQAGWTFVVDDRYADVAEEVENTWLNLGLKRVLYQVTINALIDGDGYAGIGLREKATPDLAGPPPGAVIEVDYLYPFRRTAVVEQVREDDPFSPDYGSWRSYKIRRVANEDPVEVHSSRILHMQPFPSAFSVYGNSVFQRLYTIAQITDNALWAVGQAIYQLVFKVWATDLVAIRNQAAAKGLTERELMEEYARDFNVLTTIIVDKGSKERPGDKIELPGLGSGLSVLPAIREFLTTVTSAACRIPQSRLVGNEQGKLSGAEWDAQTYYARIRAMQELHLQPLIEKVTDYILQSLGLDPAALRYRIEFNPLYVASEEQKAKTAKILAETDAVYLDRGVRTPDEVRQERGFGPPLMEELEAPLAVEGAHEAMEAEGE